MIAAILRTMEFQLAQLNIARLLHPLDHPEIVPFVEALDPINALAEASPGFVWRLQSSSGNATDLAHPWSNDPFVIVNLSVWQSPAALKAYVYNSDHRPFLNRRTEFFERPTEPHYVLWWIPAGHIPTLEEAAARLERYRTSGPTPDAFWFSALQPAPDSTIARA